MRVRKAALILPVLFLVGCADRHTLTAPDAPLQDLVIQSTVHTVSTALDDGSAGSLRAILSFAANGDVITFDPALAGATITLTPHQDLHINRSITISGPQGGITISGDGQTRIFRIDNLYQVVLENLTLTAGLPSSNAFSDAGGAIISFGNLTIRNSTITDSRVSLWGGGIYVSSTGSLTLINSTVSNNWSSNGGGIYSSGGNLNIVNSTVSGNSASGSGGGIANYRGTLTLTHGTVANNGAQSGGGIFNRGEPDWNAVTSLVNSIVAGNVSATLSGGPDILNSSSGFANPSDVFVTLSANHSLVGVQSGHSLGAAGNNLIGVDPAFVLDAFHKPLLADNGGPTKTHALLAGSPAIDAADLSVCTAAPVNGLDQRGEPRPQGAGCDMGAFEANGTAPPVTPPSVSALSINASAIVNRATGVATLTGSMTCPTAGTVQLRVSLSQEQKQRGVPLTVVGVATIGVECDGTTAWAASVTGSNGVFVNGNANAGAETLNVTPSAQDGRSVRLSWSK